MNYWLIFLTGLTTGGLSCLAMQGGLLASVITNQKESSLGEPHKKQKINQLGKDDLLPVGMFLGTKLIVHTIFGFLLGLLGSVITLSLGMRLFFQTFTALFMLATAMNLLNVHPIFRYVVFQPPRFIRKWIKSSADSKDLFAPGILGAMTIFIPCGITQAMEVLAINTGSPIAGALTMFFFVLGTSPLFTVLGVATAKLSESLNHWFLRVAAIALIGMSIYSLNGVLTVLNSPFSAKRIWYVMTTPIGGTTSKKEKIVNEAVIEDGVQKMTIQILNSGYYPSTFTVKKDIPVELTLKSNGVYTCALAFTMRQFGISEFLEPVDERTVTLTPTKAGNYIFTCSMGMYTGVMKVI